MNADLPAVSDELFNAAVRAFYARRFPDGDQGEFLMLRLDSELYAEDFRSALAVAYAAGRESMGELVEAETRDSYQTWEWYDDGTVDGHRYSGPDDEDLRAWAFKSAAEAVAHPENGCVRAEVRVFKRHVFHADMQVLGTFTRNQEGQVRDA